MSKILIVIGINNGKISIKAENNKASINDVGLAISTLTTILNKQIEIFKNSLKGFESKDK